MKTEIMKTKTRVLVLAFAIVCIRMIAGFSVNVYAGEKVGDITKNISVLKVSTDNGEEPKCDYVGPPYAGLWGGGITNNEYESCNVSFYDSDNVLVFNDKAKIKIRGNTSAYARKKPYKLKLDKKQDFTNGVSAKKWILLSGGTNLKYIFANRASVYCGMEWQPSFQYVNLYLNDEYKGCYVLTESVENINKRLNMDEEGFLIENDAYWWNSDLYFKVPGQIDPLGFTFKYPDSDDIIGNSEYVENLKNYMSEVVSAIKEDSDRYMDYIDVRSFAAWFLVNDYFCNIDAGGSNMYWYMLNKDSKLKLGPTWDYDSNYTGDKNGWSLIHNSGINYGDELFSKKSFWTIYKELFKEKKGIYDDLSQYVNEYLAVYGESLQRSWEQDAAKWGGNTGSVEEQKELYLNWYKGRVAWIDNATAAWGAIATITVAPMANILNYNGQPQELVTAGKAEGGEMQYALGNVTEATESYTATIPAKTDIGTYYVWYKVVGDSDHGDSETACVTAKISQAQQSQASEEQITISKRPAIKKPKAKKIHATISWNKLKQKTKAQKKIWNKIKQIELQWSTDPGFPAELTNQKIIGKRKTKTNITGLQRRTWFYVRIRFSDGQNGYSRWSKVRKFRTK